MENVMSSGKGEKIGFVKRTMDALCIDTTKEAAFIGAALVGTVLAGVGIAHVVNEQHAGLNQSFGDSARTHITGFDHVNGDVEPAGLKDVNVADVVLKDGRTCHVSFMTPNDPGILSFFTNRAEIINLNDCPVAAPLTPDPAEVATS